MAVITVSRWAGIREISSTASISASGDQAEIAWLITLSAACSTLPASDAAMPRANTARTPHPMRFKSLRS
ncbi:hypothetical protein [Actinoplanes sp. GCM10030250]|uniref:hypothetical protein n=1 Tax=Actinoplanes sp. GCM10030250 TaxID=3273376 RepID=UPI0036197F70